MSTSADDQAGRLRHIRKLLELLKPPPPNPERQAERLKTVEREIMLPVKVIFIGLLSYYLYFPQWMLTVTTMTEVVLEYTQKFFLVYAGYNVVLAVMLMFINRITMHVLHWVVFFGNLLDGLMLAALTLLTNGFESILYWFFPALIVRNALSIPLAGRQLTLNFAASLSYLLAGLLHVELLRAQPLIIEERSLRVLDMAVPENPTEPFLLRLMVLFLLAFVCYGLQMLSEKQRLAVEEAREVAVRQGQLDTAGRLSAEIAHQIKNPLGIINNVAFNLQRTLPEGNGSAWEQVQVIRDEVERADRIITDLLGYARLVEGVVEKLDVPEELDRAIAQVFPPGQYQIEVRRQYASDLPVLMMQRGHLAEIFVNILLNAREALHGQGRVAVTVDVGQDHSVVVSVADNGPGVPPDRVEQIFEPYYTTKPKGTGLGLAIVRHSMDMYGGKVRVESELGQGARFILQFPAKTLLKTAK